MLLAIYGTLRKNDGANIMLQLLMARYVGKGKVRGYKMFALRVPFAVRSEDYDVPDDKIQILDYYEGSYRRVKVNVELEDGRTFRCTNGMI